MEFDNKKWVVNVCHVGKKCWCRKIHTIDDYEVISEGCISKEFAKYIVFLHNQYIKNIDKTKGL